VDQTKMMFESLADLRALAHTLARREAGDAAPAAGAAEALAVFRPLLWRALAVKPNRKARYRVLTSLVPRVGVDALLSEDPGLVRSCLVAMADQGVGTCAANLLEALLLARGREADRPAGDAWWIEPMVDVLGDGDSKVRHGLCNYALPTVAKARPGGIAALLAAMQVRHAEGDGNLWGMTAVIKTARRCGQEGRLDGSGPVVGAREMSAFLREALLHADSELRLNALEMLCLHAKQTEPPSQEELALVREFLSLNMKSSSSHYRQRSPSLSPMINRILQHLPTRECISVPPAPPPPPPRADARAAPSRQVRGAAPQVPHAPPHREPQRARARAQGRAGRARPRRKAVPCAGPGGARGGGPGGPLS
jgi:hypothetical protein